MKKTRLAIPAIIIIFFQSCSSGPQPIRYGVAECDYCKMTIMDKRFASQWVTNKGKAYSFDDVHCMKGFRKTNQSEGTAYINDFTGKQELVNAEKLFFAHSEEIQTPMGGNIVTFISQVDRDKVVTENNGRALSWKEIQTQLEN
jgi:copper chaperone NosL